MRIAIDARLNAYRQGGIPQYTRQLLTALAEVAHDDEFISLQHRDHLRPLVVASNVARRTVLTPPHHRFEQWTLPLEVMLARPDVLHCPDFIAPTRRTSPAVVTIHDLAFMHYPEILDDAARSYYGQIRQNAARANAIIAVSEATRQDIAQFLDIAIEDIAMIHEAAAPIYTQIELREGEARVLGSTPVAADSFMLFVSTLEPRKNVPTLLQALRICLDRRPDCPYRLVVAGSRGWRDSVIFDTARDLKLGDHVLFVGSVGQYDLRWLYNACRLYINPSLYEGFGLPLLEAMACGAACLAAATSSLPEIGGDAAVYVPPLDAGLWADAIEALWDDQDRRAELGRMGLARAQRFSWARAARETLKVYQYAISGAGSLPAPPPAARASVPPLALEVAPSATAGRTCLRCGAEMLPSQLQHGILAAQFDASSDGLPTARAWICSRCGQVELVVEQAVALVERAAPASAEQLALWEDDAAPAEQAAPIDPLAALEDDAVPVEMIAFGQPPKPHEPPEQAPAHVSDELPTYEGPTATLDDAPEHVAEAQPHAAPGDPALSADGDTNGALAPSDLPANAEPDQLALEVPHHAGQNGKTLEPPMPESTSAIGRPAAATTTQKQRQPRTKRRKSS